MNTETLERADTGIGDASRMVLTLTVAGQLCGVPVLAVRDVLGPQTITRIPLAPPEVAGSLNLRGRIVTAIDLRRRLSLPPRPSSSIRASCIRCWLTRWARCCRSARLSVRPIRPRWMLHGRRSRWGYIGWARACWW